MNRSTRHRGARAVALLILCLALTGVTAASCEAAVTLGSALENKPGGYTECSNGLSTRGCLVVQEALPGRELVAPFSGVIVRWHVLLGEPTEAQKIRIRILHTVAPEEFKVISSGPLENVHAGEGAYEFPAALPIARGDQVGLEGDSSKKISWETVSVPGAQHQTFNLGPGLDGSETGPPGGLPAESEVTFNVQVEPDCDNDGLGDETQDPDTSSCHPRPAAPTTPPQASAQCVVPKLQGKTLRAARKRARRAHCRLGRVKLLVGTTDKTGKVVRQQPKAGKVKMAASRIRVTLG
jgi:hypothetical protein